MIDPQFALSRNLHDAGCDAPTAEEVMKLHAKGNTVEELRRLQQHRTTLLNKVHKNQKNIDCLDFLIFKLGQIHALSATSRENI